MLCCLTNPKPNKESVREGECFLRLSKSFPIDCRMLFPVPKGLPEWILQVSLPFGVRVHEIEVEAMGRWTVGGSGELFQL